ncbi:hypothetical protein SapgrDRAFT_3130 [Saprospira grandis DSM 2844]|uniref:Uncharacterized protein n=1 Tax=Saprospira grandis DSM 2844 TaxID=694433 RepID=J0PAW0_9BACT|nr:hypothetical protein [Saprospira grandis]EJF54777.1 hypothetical protein SapgrDRAFT_3130 [Saprospira grandis DSM 2844]
MKTPSSDLFRMIQAMSSAEKRYFKKDSRDSHTSHLFDLINEQEEYDEEQIKRRLRDASFAKNLKVHKNRLQQLLLKSLRAYHEEKTGRSKVRVLLDNAEILIQKQLYDLAISQLDKASNLAEEFEEYELLLECRSLQARLGQAHRKVKPPFLALQETAALLHNYSQYALVNEELSRMMNAPSSPLESKSRARKMQRLVEEQILDKDYQPASSKAMRSWWQSQALLAKAKGRDEEALAHSQAALDSMEERPKLVQAQAAAYLKLLMNHFSFSLGLQEEGALWVEFEKAEAHCKKHKFLYPRLLHLHLLFILYWQDRLEGAQMAKFLTEKSLPLIKRYGLEQQAILGQLLPLVLSPLYGGGHFGELQHCMQLLQGLELPNLRAKTIDLIVYWENFRAGKLRGQLAEVEQDLKGLGRQANRYPFYEKNLKLLLQLGDLSEEGQLDLLALYAQQLRALPKDAIWQEWNQLLPLTDYWEAFLKN